MNEPKNWYINQLSYWSLSRSIVGTTWHQNRVRGFCIIGHKETNYVYANKGFQLHLHATTFCAMFNVQTKIY